MAETGGVSTLPERVRLFFFQKFYLWIVPAFAVVIFVMDSTLKEHEAPHQDGMLKEPEAVRNGTTEGTITESGDPHQGLLQLFGFGILFHLVFASAITLSHGRRYRAFGFVRTWWGYSIVQCFGLGFAVVVNEFVNRSEIKSSLVTLYGVYSAISSELLKFPVKFEITASWISTAACLESNDWFETGKVSRNSVLVLLILAAILLLRNYLAEYEPMLQDDPDGTPVVSGEGRDPLFPEDSFGLRLDQSRDIIRASANVVLSRPEKWRLHMFENFQLWGVPGLLLFVAVFVFTFSLNGIKHPLLFWCALVLLGHLIVALITTGLGGRQWKYWWCNYLLSWWGKSIIQIFGLGFAISVSQFVVRTQLPAYYMLLYCMYAVCSSQLLKFPIKLEITSTWMSTAAMAAWAKKPIGDPQAWTISLVLAGIVFLRNYLDYFAPQGGKGRYPVYLPSAQQIRDEAAARRQRTV